MATITPAPATVRDTNKWGGMRSAGYRGVHWRGAVELNSVVFLPSEDVPKTDQAIEQRADNQRLFAMHVISLARHFEMLDHSLNADAKDNRRFHCRLASRRPQKTFSLAIAELRYIRVCSHSANF